MPPAMGRYELFRRLGRGGMAEVFLARRRAAGVEKWLVVKRLRPERVGDVRFLELFVREARLSMSLAHQNIVPVFDFGRSDDQVFIAMERVEGKDLGSTLKRATQLGIAMPEVLVAFVAAECCQALAYAHDRRSPEGSPLGIVHRDVTPRNLMLSWSGEVKLTDFGIAALADDAARTIVGTPAYMAPEQARGEPLDPRADIYGLGMVIREALTGERPRREDEHQAMLAAARSGELLPWPLGTTSPLVAIVDRATAADREQRYPDARHMLEELDGFIVGERAAKKSDAPTRRLAAWLTEVWKDHGEDTASDLASDEPIHDKPLVSFLDDTKLAGAGTGTMRSMAMTAAHGEGETLADPHRGEAPAARPGAIKHWRWLVLVVATTALGAGAYAVATRASTPTISAASRDAAIADETNVANGARSAHDTADPHAAGKPRDAGSARDAAIESVAIDAAVRTRHSDRPRVNQPRPTTPPSPALHTVLINAKPGWAYFTVDADPTQYQTLAKLQLAVGTHIVHFTQGGAHKNVTIAVPDNDDLRVIVDFGPHSDAAP